MNGTEVIAGRFELLRPWHAGTWARCYRARDVLTGDTVAVKTMLRRRNGEPVSLREADKNAARFMREVRIMARLYSPNLPRTIAGGLDGDQPYLAMEYIDGMTAVVAARRGGRRLPVAWAAAIGAQIAAGLDAAHRAGVVHRDLKPSNVMLASGGRGEGARLRRRPDPRRRGRRAADQLQRDGRHRQVHGTRAGQRSATVTAAVDLYALGCVLYEMLIGAPPFDGDTAVRGAEPAHRASSRPRSACCAARCPAALEAVVARLLEKDPANRPGTAAEVAELLLPFALAAGTRRDRGTRRPGAGACASRCAVTRKTPSSERGDPARPRRGAPGGRTGAASTSSPSTSG